ncbi:MAG: type II toxin-antitoxin system VapC family toxin [Candidatus Aminicenantes bacterium]|nr:MAG: type II toxin-antitoxin system VapC family toxin [Candidatus Aminicenantes bacterium]
MYLVDTNIFLEALLEQEKVEDVRSFFQTVDLDYLYITDLALHSIGILLFKFKKYRLFVAFLNDMVKNGMNIISLSTEELLELKEIVEEFNLDFDDAYQYLAAKNHYLQLISFDKDFNRTDINKKEPQEVPEIERY